MKLCFLLSVKATVGETLRVTGHFSPSPFRPSRFIALALGHEMYSFCCKMSVNTSLGNTFMNQQMAESTPSQFKHITRRLNISQQLCCFINEAPWI